MGYSEVCCHLCGVSFSIGRFRRVDEPPEAAWQSSDWSVSEGTFIASEVSRSACSTETGCCVTFRTESKKERHEWSVPTDVAREFLEDYDEDADSDYEYESASEDPLEYDSDESNQGDEEETPEDDDKPVSFCEDYLTLMNTGNPLLKSKKPEVFYPIESESRDFENALWRREKIKFNKPDAREGTEDKVELVGVEHIAGPGCDDQRGYNGNAISAEEMKGCCTFQCLAYKPKNWTPEPDDQDFELQSECYLTGLGDRFPSRDADWPRFAPVRHGWETGHADTENYMGGDEENRNIAMPFHPTCFDIFTRLSKLHLGHIDVNGLMSWRNNQWNQEDDNDDLPRDPNIDHAAGQSWEHCCGSEYLAANPLYIPGLPPILRSAVQDDPKFDPRNGAFSILQESSSAPQRNTFHEDAFLQLPQELREYIVGYLNSTDIAALRSASRAFQQLPISLWYSLLRREMPWLWEVWSDDKPLFWTALEVPRIRSVEAQGRYQAELSKKRVVIREEMPELLNEWIKNYPAYIDTRSDRDREVSRLASMLERLPRAKTNWYQVYRDVTVHWSGLKGLRNRRRIWTYVEEIIRRMKEGKI